MKCINVNNTSSKEVYELWDDDKVLAGISFSKHTRFARIVSKLGKRMFSFEKKGFLNPRKLIRDEYGFKMGMVEEPKPGLGRGIVVLDGKRYQFVYDENNTGELKVYDEGMKKNLVTCNFKSINTGISKTRSLLDNRFASLLLLLCWYCFQQHHTVQVPGIFKDADLMLS